MLRPIREELGFSYDIYESLDDELIDVTYDRLEEARRQKLPFDHFQISQNTPALVTEIKELSITVPSSNRTT